MGKIISACLSFFLIFLFAFALAGVQAGRAQEGSALEVPATEQAEMGGRTSSGLPIPRFVSLSAEKVFVRTGPALRYPIKWVYQRQHMPVEVIQEFDTWRKVRDMDGEGGWVHQSLLSGERAAVIQGELALPIRKERKEDGRIIAMFEPGVVAAVERCQGEWCAVSSNGYDGWIQRKFLWGIYDAEDFD